MTGARQKPLVIPRMEQEYLVSNAGLTPVTARRAIETLVERGVLETITGGRRNTVWAHRGILTTLDEYAEQLRRV
ncbi:hypothetical protein [Bifidobacterium samirii]|uniref:hypothetical protein n=1 Tax=Bifidobacterium samirii TaxID=2306974 RepID=UPI000F7DE372|nr:hypothetical protein [Bifidobacterium samirii]